MLKKLKLRTTCENLSDFKNVTSIYDRNPMFLKFEGYIDYWPFNDFFEIISKVNHTYPIEQVYHEIVKTSLTFLIRFYNCLAI